MPQMKKKRRQKQNGDWVTVEYNNGVDLEMVKVEFNGI